MCFPTRYSSPAPAYSPRSSSPTYSSTSRPTERTLHRSRGRSQSPTGVFVRRSGDVTLMIFGQEENIEQPLVRPSAPLTGSVLIQKAENIKSVVLTINGHLETLPLAGSYLSVPLFSVTHKLHETDHKGAPTCPNSFAFSQRFPSVFRHDGRLCNLPPTCHITFGSLHFIKCVYHITVVATSVRHRPASFLTRSDSVSFDLTYRPRTSPARPLLSNPSIYGTIKTCPEEWMQASHMVELSGQHDAPSLICNLFAPAVDVFCVLEPIPFHLQLSTSRKYLQNIFSGPLPLVKVYILRQIAMNARGRMVTQSLILGQGTIRPLPADRRHTLNWEGEACCRDPASVVGTFECGTIAVVTDRLMVEISPPHKATDSVQLRWPRFQFGYTIKLTTHKWDY
ncbi:hypothetical protein C8F04DRAFT_396429 [Mycena alexandri]|uniref:Uncharacterized protein n=1 Tax=Mycena alexandri TaxID=1745969 RepID=A0AAD6XA61_9AGAR|nr:hypothetical protein C8F04DRAFT_396429 [Mycena alexandri]